MGRRILKAAGILTLLGGLYFGTNYMRDIFSNNSFNLNSITKSIDNKYKIRENFQKVIEAASSLEKKIIFKLKGDKAENPKAYSNEKDLKPEMKPVKFFEPEMKPVFLHGKSLDDYFKEFDELIPEQQEYLAKSLNNLSVWDFILLSRYVPIDGILKELSSFYSTDYKWHLQSLFSESILNPMTIGPTDDKGLGQITHSSEKWARELYNRKGYKFPGPEINHNLFDPYTNLVLSSIIFRKATEKKVSDFDAAYSLYTNGNKGVIRDKNGFYVINLLGLEDVNRAKKFDYITDRLILFSWISMKRPDLGKHIKDNHLRKVIETNNSEYDAKIAYEGMIDFLNSISDNKKYSEENLEIFRIETINISTWLKNLYNSTADYRFLSEKKK